MGLCQHTQTLGGTHLQFAAPSLIVRMDVGAHSHWCICIDNGLPGPNSSFSPVQAPPPTKMPSPACVGSASSLEGWLSCMHVLSLLDSGPLYQPGFVPVAMPTLPAEGWHSILDSRKSTRPGNTAQTMHSGTDRGALRKPFKLKPHHLPPAHSPLFPCLLWLFFSLNCGDILFVLL